MSTYPVHVRAEADENYSELMGDALAEKKPAMSLALLKVRAFDGTGVRLWTGGDQISAEVCDGTAQPCQLVDSTDAGDGTYDIRFRRPENYTFLKVKVNGKDKKVIAVENAPSEESRKRQELDIGLSQCKVDSQGISSRFNKTLHSHLEVLGNHQICQNNLTAMINKSEQCQRKLDNNTYELHSTRQELSQREEEVKRGRSQIEALEEERQRLQDGLSEAGKQKEECKKNLDNKTYALNDKQKEVETGNRRIGDLEKNLRSLQADNTKLASDLTSCQKHGTL